MNKDKQRLAEESLGTQNQRRNSRNETNACIQKQRYNIHEIPRYRKGENVSITLDILYDVSLPVIDPRMK